MLLRSFNNSAKIYSNPLKSVLVFKENTSKNNQSSVNHKYLSFLSQARNINSNSRNHNNKANSLTKEEYLIQCTCNHYKITFNDIQIHWSIRSQQKSSHKVTFIFAATIVPTLFKVILNIWPKEFKFNTNKRKQKPENSWKLSLPNRPPKLYIDI